MHILWSTDDDIQVKGRIEVFLDANGLVNFIPRWHHDQNVHVAFGSRLPSSIGTEQDNFVGVKTADNSMC